VPRLGGLRGLPRLPLLLVGVLTVTTLSAAPVGAALAPEAAGRPEPAAARGPVAVARDHLAGRAAALGLARGSGLRALRRTPAAGGQDIVRFQQTLGGLPVLGAQLVTTVGRDRVLSVAGEASPWVASATFGRTAGSAARTARAVTARAHDLPQGTLRADRPGRWLYDASLLQPGGEPGARAVWRVEVTSSTRPDVRELVLVDAGTGEVLLQVDQVAALDRVVCDAALVPSADYVCKAGRYDRVEGQPATGLPDVDQAFDNTGATAGWFATRLGVDLTALIGHDRGDGRKLRSTTRYCLPEGCPFDNAAWTGDQMVYGTGFAVADDVVAHELGHGVIQNTAGLIYWFQSGAINESMADVIGELVDLSDGTGNDAPEVRWQLGEDLPPRAGGVARDMADPTAFGQPDHTASNLYDFAPDYDDNGAVHTNSGVPNKTAYLVVDGTAGEPGGAFNGAAFPGIGADKAALLYWTALQSLTPAADFGDLATVLQQSCTNLAATGAAGIVAADCASVQGAVTATGLTRWAGPSVPRAVAMTPGVRSVRLSWDAPASAGSSPVTSYAVHVHPSVRGQDFAPIEPSARQVDLRGFASGTTYTVGLVAVSADGTSPAVLRTFGGTSLRVRWPDSVPYGSSLRLRGSLVGADGSPVAGRTVRLLHRAGSGGRWDTVVKDRTSASGGFTLPTAAPARRSASYAVVFAGGGSLMGVRTAAHRVPVRQAVTVAVDRTVRVGETAVFRGEVRPTRSGTVTLQRRQADGGWRAVDRAQLGGGGYVLRARMPSRRPSAWRVVVGPRPGAGLAAGSSRVVTLRVP
jgi:Zn-dependent metalloprotease